MEFFHLYNTLVSCDHLQNRKPSNARERYLKPSELDHDPSGSAFTYNIKGLHQQTKYIARIQAQNEAGWSPESSDFEFTTSGIGEVENFASTSLVQKRNPDSSVRSIRRYPGS